MFTSLSEIITRTLTRRRIVAASVAGVALLGCSVAAPPVVNALRYDALIDEHNTTRGQLRSAQTDATEAQHAFAKAAAEAMATRTDIAAFIQTVDPDLLADTAPLSELIAALESLDERAGIHEESWQKGVKVVPQTAPMPRIPARTSPVSVDGLTFAITRNTDISRDFSAAAEQMTDRIDDVSKQTARAGALIEEVLASAATFGTSASILSYDKASVTARIHLNQTVGELTDTTRDPLARLTAFQEAVAGVKASHAEGIAEEERIAREKKEAEERAAEEERLAQEQARLEEEQARQAAEDAEREKSNEEQSIPEPQPTPPADAETPAPEPTPTPAPTP